MSHGSSRSIYGCYIYTFLISPVENIVFVFAFALQPFLWTHVLLALAVGIAA